MKRNAFTLLELLITVGVIGVLAGLIMGSTLALRNRVKDFQCRNNLKQWGLATQLYAMDHQYLLPPEGSPNGLSKDLAWYVELPVVLKIRPYHEMEWRDNPDIEPESCLWICPANPRRSNGKNLFHYCLNGWVDGQGEDDMPTQLVAIDDPARVVWLFDNGGRAAVAQQNNIHTNLHSGGAHITFLDGHVEHRKKEDYWDTKRNKGRLDNPEIVWIP